MANSKHDKTPSTGNLERLLSEASVDASDASTAVAEISAIRVAQLLRLPTKDRLGHIDDPTLTDTDRDRLTNSLVAPSTLPKGRGRDGKPAQAAKRRSKNRGWMATIEITPRLVRCILLLSVALGGLCSAWFSTATGRFLIAPAIGVQSTPYEQVVEVEPDPGKTIAISQWRGVSMARWWLPRGGYSTVTLRDPIFSNLPSRGK